MAQIIDCDYCGKKLTGVFIDGEYYRDYYISLTRHRCESPYNNNEEYIPDEYYCHAGCLKSYYSQITVTTGDSNGTTATSGGSTDF